MILNNKINIITIRIEIQSVSIITIKMTSLTLRIEISAITTNNQHPLIQISFKITKYIMTIHRIRIIIKTKIDTT